MAKTGKDKPQYERGRYSDRLRSFGLKELGEIHARFSAVATDLLTIYDEMRRHELAEIGPIDGANSPQRASDQMAKFADHAYAALHEAIRAQRQKEIEAKLLEERADQHRDSA